VGASSGLYGNFVLAWAADLPTFDDVEGAVVGPDADVVSAGPLIVSNEAHNQTSPALDCAASGACLVAYRDDDSQGAQADFDVRARLFRPVVFSDRFETGNLSPWSSSVP
jgi:hypothetical protein